MFFRFLRRNNNAGGIDDSVIIPPQGCIDGSVRLPTYRPKKDPVPHFTKPTCVELTIEDVLWTISQDVSLARRVLWETARLKRRIYSFGPLKLSQNAPLVDKKLNELNDVVIKGCILITARSGPDAKKQDLVIKGKKFQKALFTAKKSLLDLEKSFNDNVLSELKDGMKRKGSVDHKKLVEAITGISEDMSTVYGNLITVHYEEMEARELAEA